MCYFLCIFYPLPVWQALLSYPILSSICSHFYLPDLTSTQSWLAYERKGYSYSNVVFINELLLNTSDRSINTSSPSSISQSSRTWLYSIWMDLQDDVKLSNSNRWHQNHLFPHSPKKNAIAVSFVASFVYLKVPFFTMAYSSVLQLSTVCCELIQYLSVISAVTASWNRAIFLLRDETQVSG